MSSLSARRAWIEIIDYIIDYVTDASLSARRAWIEIVEFHLFAPSGVVALRKESVDRNKKNRLFVGSSAGRSPQGERG